MRRIFAGCLTLPLSGAGLETQRHHDEVPDEQEMKITIFEATMIAEGVEEADEETQVEAWQMLHDTRVAYQLQGWFGRTAASLIEQGVINA